MPRPQSNQRPAVIPTTALVASATRYTGKVARIYQPSQPWQTEAYRHYGICGEARYAARFFGHAVSRAVLGVAEIVEGVAESSDTGDAYDLIVELFNGEDGQKEMLDAIGVHLTVAGECYLVGRTDKASGNDIWEIVSIMEMKVTGSKWQIDYSDGTAPINLTDDDVAIRIWLPDPAKKMFADSPFKSLLPILGEIEYLTRHVFAQIQSRLAGAGILMLPDEMQFPSPPPTDGEEIDTSNQASIFMATLGDAMMTPIEDPGSPSSLIPIVVTANGDAIDKAKLLTFWSELDSESKELRNEALRRFALGVDMPPEQLLGMSSNGGTGGGSSNGVSHWGAWQIEESTIKLHVEPMLDVIVNAITVGYLRPGLDDGDTLWIVTYDSSALRLRPDRSKEAFELYDRGLLKAEVLLRENGFDKDDMPDEDEFKMWLIRKIASGSNTPEQVGAAVGMLGVSLPVAQIEQGTTREAPLDPSLEEHPTRPRTPDESAAALVAGCNALVFRALERAGNRLRQQGVKPNCPSYETHRYVQANGNAPALLDDAWSCAPQVLAGVTDEPDKVIDTLNRYTTALLTTGQPHSREAMEVWLR